MLPRQDLSCSGAGIAVSAHLQRGGGLTRLRLPYRYELTLPSRNGRALTRYFPEVLPAFRKLGPSKLVLDGELVVVGANGLDFGALQQRVHPADSRVRMLSEATPAWFIAFDILAEAGTDLRKEPLGERRKPFAFLVLVLLASPWPVQLRSSVFANLC